MIYTTLTHLRRHGACQESMRKLIPFLGEGWDKKAPIYLTQELIECVGTEAVVWALCATPKALSKERDRVARLFAVWCARQVLPIFEKDYPNDNRPRNAIDVAELYANGQATDEELSAARDAARDAARSAARDAALDAALDAARSAARSAQGKALLYISNTGNIPTDREVAEMVR